MGDPVPVALAPEDSLRFPVPAQAWTPLALVAGALAVVSFAAPQESAEAQGAQWRAPSWLAVDLPLTPWAVEKIFENIVGAARRPGGLEVVHHERQPGPPGKYVLQLGGLTISEVFDLFRQYGVAYEASVDGGLIVARPAGAGSDMQALLNRTLPFFRMTDASLDEAFFGLCRAIDPGFRPPRNRPSPTRLRASMPDRYRRIQGAIEKRMTIRLERTSVLSALNAIVIAHGEIWWKVTRWPESTGLQLTGFDGWSIGVELRNR